MSNTSDNAVRSAEDVACNREEGCDHPAGFHKWEIQPHPHTHDFDSYVSDNDADALEALRDLVENKWDDMTPGDQVIIKIRMNKP